MKKLLLLIVPALLLAGCQGSGSTDAYPGQIPPDAKFTEAKDPAITADTRYAAGQLAESTGQFEQAAAQYNQALKTDPKHAPSLYRLGVMNAQQKNFPAAIDAWQRYIQATGSAAAGWGNLGFCYELMGDVQAAETSYKKGIERSSKDPLCRVNYGLMLARLGRVNEALVQLQAVLTPAAAHYNLGSVYEQKGKSAQAKMEYTRALEIDPTFFEAQQRLASME